MAYIHSLDGWIVLRGQNVQMHIGSYELHLWNGQVGLYTLLGSYDLRDLTVLLLMEWHIQ